MNGRLKAIGLALFAMLALGAIAAQGAMAEQLFHSTSESGNTYLTAHQENGEGIVNEFQLDDGSGKGVHCDEATFETTEPIANTATAVTVYPEYKHCETNEPGDTVVTTEGCHYELTSHLVPTTEGEEHAEVEIEECEGEGHIEFTVSSLCNVYITDPQKEEDLTHGVVYKNELNAQNEHTYITVEATVHGIHWEVTNTFFCTVGGLKAHTGNDGTYFNTLTVEGFEDAAHTEHTAIWWE